MALLHYMPELVRPLDNALDRKASGKSGLDAVLEIRDVWRKDASLQESYFSTA